MIEYFSNAVTPTQIDQFLLEMDGRFTTSHGAIYTLAGLIGHGTQKHQAIFIDMAKNHSLDLFRFIEPEKYTQRQ